MADVVYLIQDMLFTSKVREVAKQVGVSVQGTRDVGGAGGGGRRGRQAGDRRPAPADRALEALARLGSDPATRAIPSVGFIDHEKTDVMDAGARQRLRSGHGQGAVRERAAQALRSSLRA